MINRFGPPGPIEISGKKRKTTTQKTITIALGLFLIALLGWLAVKKFSVSPQEKVTLLIQERQWKEAAHYNYKLSQKKEFSDLRLLAYGVAIEYGLREERISHPDLPHYPYQKRLQELDTTGIFIKEAFFLKSSLFVNSPHFLQELCSLVQTGKNFSFDEKLFEATQKALRSGASWYMADDGCMEKILTESSATRIFTARVSGDKLTLRSRPTRQSTVLTQLARNSRLLILKQSPQKEKIAGKEAYWYEVLTKEQNRGWVFGGYLELVQP